MGNEIDKLNKFINLYEQYSYMLASANDEANYRKLCLYLLQEAYGINDLTFDMIKDINWTIFKATSKPTVTNMLNFDQLDVQSIYKQDVAVIMLAILMSLIIMKDTDSIERSLLKDIVKHTCLPIYCNGDQEILETKWVEHIEKYVLQLVELIDTHIHSSEIISKFGKVLAMFVTVKAGDQIVVFTMRQGDIDYATSR